MDAHRLVVGQRRRNYLQSSTHYDVSNLDEVVGTDEVVVTRKCLEACP